MNTSEIQNDPVAAVPSSAVLEVQTAHFESLCSCVAVVFGDNEEARFKGCRPEQVQNMIHAAIAGGRRDRIVLADCETCNGTGLIV